MPKLRISIDADVDFVVRIEAAALGREASTEFRYKKSAASKRGSDSREYELSDVSMEEQDTE